MHWMDLLLAITGLLLGAGEVYAIKNKVPGDTITERVRHYFRVKKDNASLVGAFAFIMFFGTLCFWFVAHILKYVAGRL